MSASTAAKEAGLKSLAQMMTISGQARSTLEDWSTTRPQLFGVVAFGCKKMLEAVPEGWTYTFVIDHPHQHIFIHENYAPDVEDADSQNIVMESTFIEGLNEIKERTE